MWLPPLLQAHPRAPITPLVDPKVNSSNNNSNSSLSRVKVPLRRKVLADLLDPLDLVGQEDPPIIRILKRGSS